MKNFCGSYVDSTDNDGVNPSSWARRYSDTYTSFTFNIFMKLSACELSLAFPLRDMLIVKLCSLSILM